MSSENRLKVCAYCGKEKPETEFNCEHIWPSNLGGDVLDSFWQTTEVCSRCNGLAGLHVDAAFTKSWLIQVERTTGVDDYLAKDMDNEKFVYPLHYMGKLEGYEFSDNEIAEQWLGPCGANIIHFRDKDDETTWSPYAGGDPKKNKKRSNGRVYISLTSENEFWICQALVSVRKNFSCARFVVNMEIPDGTKYFKNPNFSDSIQAKDMEVVSAVNDTTNARKKIEVSGVIDTFFCSRFLAKLALGVGHKLFGKDFINSVDGKNLSKALWERDSEKRSALPIRGVGILADEKHEKVSKHISWVGGWVLYLTIVDSLLSLTVVSPSSKMMCIVVTDNPYFIERAKNLINGGKIWVTVPCIGKAVGPISLMSYLSHRHGTQEHPELTILESLRSNPTLLPPCWPST